MPVGDVRVLEWEEVPAGTPSGIGNAEPALAFPLEAIGEFPWDILSGRTLVPEVPEDVVSVATFNVAGFWIVVGGGAGPETLGLPPIASYRCTMSDIDVLRVLLEAGSSGEDSPEEGSAALLSLLEFATGKTYIDEGRVRPDGGVCVCAAPGLLILEDCFW
jgi:hypothetical protein